MPAKTATKRAPIKTTSRAPLGRPAAKRGASATKPAPAPVVGKSTAAKKPARVAGATPQAPKSKLIRDSFTMPQSDFALIAGMKERALSFKRPTKKSELLRAGLHALSAQSDAALRASLEALAPLKPGRPKKLG